MHVGVGGLVIRKARRLVVPLERLAGETNGDGSEQGGLRERTAVAEVGTGLAASADRFNPVPMVVLDPRKLFRRGILAGVLLHDIFRQQPAAATAVRTVHKHPFVAEEDGPGARDLVVRREILWPGYRVIAVEPDEFDRAALVAGRELEGDLRGGSTT